MENSMPNCFGMLVLAPKVPDPKCSHRMETSTCRWDGLSSIDTEQGHGGIASSRRTTAEAAERARLCVSFSLRRAMRTVEWWYG